MRHSSSWQEDISYNNITPFDSLQLNVCITNAGIDVQLALTTATSPHNACESRLVTLPIKNVSDTHYQSNVDAINLVTANTGGGFTRLIYQKTTH